MIGQGLGRVALAEKLSIGQLQEALQNRTIPAYIGIPLLEEKIQFEQRMRSAGQGIAPQMDQPPIADQVMAQAAQMDGEGIDQLPIETPELAGGGIVAFEDGGQVQRFQNQGLVADPNFGMGTGEVSMPREELVNLLTLQELQEYNRSGNLPERLRSAVGSRPVESGSFLGNLPLARQPAQFAAPPTPPASTAPAPTAAPTAKPAPTPKATAPKPPASDVALITPEGAKAIPRAGLSVEDFKRQQAAFGITGDVDSDLKKQIDELAKGTKEERQQAKYMALLQAGLGIMGGTSPFALQNIAAGAQRGITQYAGDVKDIKAQERDLMKMRGELARAEDARKRGDFKAFMDAQSSAEDMSLKRDKLAIDRSIAATQKAYFEGRLTDAQAKNRIAAARVGQAQVLSTLKAREFFTDNEEPALKTEFEKRFGKNWAKSPELMVQFNRQKEGRIRELSMLGSQGSGIPSAEDLMED
jgi:hypothetical protein